MNTNIRPFGRCANGLKMTWAERDSIINHWMGKKVKWLRRGFLKEGVITSVHWDEQNDRLGTFGTTAGTVSLLVLQASEDKLSK